MIEVRGASYAYRAGSLAVDGVSLNVAPGERVVVLGRNGSGKSTLGRLLNGGLKPSEGTVSVDGERDGLARLVGYVRQDPRNQIVSALVEDEVAFGPGNLGLSREEVSERVGEALAACGIEALRGRLTEELSGGQQQLLARCALATSCSMRRAPSSTRPRAHGSPRSCVGLRHVGWASLRSPMARRRSLARTVPSCSRRVA